MSSRNDQPHQDPRKRVASPKLPESKRARTSQSGTLEDSGSGSEISPDSDSPVQKFSPLFKAIQTEYINKPRNEYYSTLLATIWFHASFYICIPKSPVLQKAVGTSQVGYFRARWVRDLRNKLISLQDDTYKWIEKDQATTLLVDECQYLMEHHLVTGLPESGNALHVALIKQLGNLENQLKKLKVRMEQARGAVGTEEVPNPDRARPSLRSSGNLYQYKLSLKQQMRQHENLLTRLKDDVETDPDVKERIEALFQSCNELDSSLLASRWQMVIKALETSVDRFKDLTEEEELDKAKTKIYKDIIKDQISREKELLFQLRDSLYVGDEYKTRIEVLLSKYKKFKFVIEAPQSGSSSTQPPAVIGNMLAAKYWEFLSEDAKEELKKSELREAYEKAGNDLGRATAKIDAKYPKGDLSEKRLEEYMSTETRGLAKALKEVEDSITVKYGRPIVHLFRLNNFESL